MPSKGKSSWLFSMLAILSFLMSGLPADAAVPSESEGIVIDGIKEDAWGAPLALDPAGDMTEPNLDLAGLYLVEDSTHYYIGFDAFASTWGMAYGIYLDTDQVNGSGAITDPWGRAVTAVPEHLPEHTLYVWHIDSDALEEAELNHWDGAGWSYDSLIDQGGDQAYSPANDWIEYQVPKAALGNPTSLALEVFTTGGAGHAQDTIPSDPNVAYTTPDWGGDVTMLSNFAFFPPRPIWYASGGFNGWGMDNPLYDDGDHGDGAAGDGLFAAQITVPTPGRYEFKVTTEDWSTSYPNSGNSWVDTTTADQQVTISFDTRLFSDGWLPTTNVIGVSTEPGTWTAVGDWQGWNNTAPESAMIANGGGLYTLTTAIPVPGSYQFKAVKTGSWDAVGMDGRGVNAATAIFETTEPDQNVTFSVSANAGRISVDVQQAPPVPAHDNNIWWEGLAHNSRDDLYRTPGGAVTTGVPVILRLRTFHNDVTDVSLRVWDTNAGAQRIYPMQIAATSDEPPYGYDYWQATLAAQETPTILYYRFIIRDGFDEDYYEDDDLFDGAWGMVYDQSPDYSFQIDVYDPEFETPDWMKNAVVYQIFPDRFFNGDPKNDPKPNDPTVYTNPVLVQDWDDLPEGYCRNYSGVTCEEQPLGRDFFGGDLQGVIDKLDYLQDLGVTAIYFNPIFMAPSNHLYDTTDYFNIDPYFGNRGAYWSLSQLAKKRGIHLILDGVFNHTSSDSLYFDKYSRYRTLGAYESQASTYYDWYTFSDWPDQYISWWGFDTLPVLTEIPEVRSFIYANPAKNVATWWLNPYSSGWRLDVAPDKSHNFWQEFRASVKAADPDAVILGEIWDDASEWLLGDEFDSTMNYRFRRALLGFLVGETNDPNQGFIHSLDPDQFDSVLQSIEEDYPAPAFQAAMNLVGSHDTQRILWALTPGQRNREDKEFNLANLAEGKARLKLLAILQMTLPGAPAIYYGDEAGLTGDTDPDDRRPYPWDNQDTDLLAHYQALTGLRNQYSFLRTGSFDRLYTHNEAGVYAYGRKDLSGAAVVVVNRGLDAHSLTIDLGSYLPEGAVLTDGLNGETTTVTGGQVSLEVAGQWGAILITEPNIDLTPPGAPTGLAAEAGSGTVALTWSIVPGAKGYNVHRSLVTGGGYEQVNTAIVVETSFTDTTVANGKLYYYVVTAVDAAGNESARSYEVEALPSAPIGWAGRLWPESIEMTLSALDPQTLYAQVWVEGVTDSAGPGDGLLAEFAYGPAGSDPAGWDWAPMAYNVDVGNHDEYLVRFIPEAAGNFEMLARFSTNLGRDWTYAYTDAGLPGSLVVNPAEDSTPPAVPENLRLVEASPTFIHLAWDPVADQDVYRYEVYRGSTTGGPYEKLANLLSPTTEFIDWEVVKDQTYYYIVLAVDTSFNKSPYSRELEAVAHARQVQVTFHATLPEITPPEDDLTGSIYIGGSFNGWDAAGTLMDRDSLTASLTLLFEEGAHLEYKYTRGSWDYVEKGAECEEIANRTATVFYGTDGTMTLEDLVLNWRNTGTCGD